MSKNENIPIDTAAYMQTMYKSGHYISYSDIHSINFILPSAWTIFNAFFVGRGVFLDTLTSRRLLKQYSNEAYRTAHNKTIVAEAQKNLFSIEGRLLDVQQIEAVHVTEDAHLVMAAAGSGKTLSLLAKCKYLVEELHIPAKRILTVSFTSSSASELAERLHGLGIEVDGKTFHALGNSILRKSAQGAKRLANQQEIINTIIQEKTKSDNAFARQYNDYILNYFSVPSLPIEAETLEQLVSANRSFQATTLKQISLDKNNYSTRRNTQQGEKVRSKEEQIIANYLYINNIAYCYEKPYPGYSKYKPDFTITEYSEPIYLEHQGIDRAGRTRKDIDKKYYASKMQWNWRYHQNNNTRLIESFSYEFQEGTILKNLEAHLKKQGVQIIRRQEAEISKLIHQSYRYDAIELNKLFITYLGLVKTSEFSLSAIKKSLKRSKYSYTVARSRAFVSLFEQIYDAYEATLKATESIDFSDMIVMAADEVPQLPAGIFEYDYILVDEVQDLSDARYTLLKALLDRVPTSKLFAVGDDWQSIFRFAGSDLTLVNDFEKKFARHTYHSTIEQTHRFNNPLLDISSAFIKKNPSQIRKSPCSRVNHTTDLMVNSTATPDNDSAALSTELQTLLDTYGFDTMRQRKLFIIARYKKDSLRLLNTQDNRMQFRQLDDDGTLFEWTDTRTGHRLQLSFMTMHSSKGQTCDHAFILNVSGGARGIPALRDNDPVLIMLLAHEDSYANAEERRLFYVAITRATQSTVLIAQAFNPSLFLTELNLSNNSPHPAQDCPNCLSGKLMQRESGYGKFLGCSNYGFGCNYSQNIE